MNEDEAIALLTDDPSATGVFTDFDGTLAPIVDRPGDARPVEGAGETLEALARSFAVVAIVSGRSLDDLRSRIRPDGVVMAGSYGRERSDRPGRRASEGWEPVAVAATSMISELSGLVLERKGAGIALHYRTAPSLEPDARSVAETLAREFELEVLHGRLVVELVRPGPKKGDAVATLSSERALKTLLLAGDDVADVQAFEWARSADVRSVLVGVGSEEAPPSLEAMADLVVNEPGELVAFLKRLAAAL